jgi:hypothetical protein
MDIDVSALDMLPATAESQLWPRITCANDTCVENHSLPA